MTTKKKSVFNAEACVNMDARFADALARVRGHVSFKNGYKPDKEKIPPARVRSKNSFLVL